MKTILMLALGIAACGMSACCCSASKQISGTITEASMHTLTVRTPADGTTYDFSTVDADMSEANGLLLGAPVVVDYKGKLGEVTAATKVATDPTYAEAVGRWVMPDPINPEQVMGVELSVEGVAESIDMATLRYESWELQGEAGRILLKGVSEGSGEPIAFTESATITRNADGTLTLILNDEAEGTRTVLVKQTE